MLLECPLFLWYGLHFLWPEIRCAIMHTAQSYGSWSIEPTAVLPSTGVGTSVHLPCARAPTMWTISSRERHVTPRAVLVYIACTN